MELIKPYHECPEFKECSVNHCPLDPEATDRVSLPEDPEARCKARISTRTAIAIKYHLPNKGRTERELRRDERSRRTRAWWDSLPEEERQRHTARLKRSGSASYGENNGATSSGTKGEIDLEGRITPPERIGWCTPEEICTH